MRYCVGDIGLNTLLGRPANRRGPQLLAAGFMEDTGQALSSLDRLARLDASILLPGHGEPWTGPMPEAVRQARETGIS